MGDTSVDFFGSAASERQTRKVTRMKTRCAGAVLQAFVLLSLTSLSIGCTSSAFLKDPGRLIGRPHIEKNVTRVLCLWEPSQGTGLDDKPARGFSGQILFFGPRDESAARVRGEVRILEFDQFDGEVDEPQALHTFVFDADAWDGHRKEGSLGHSYSVFIPYLPKHKDAVNCALRVEFTSADGRVVRSDMIEVMLPGKAAQASTTAFRRNVTRDYTYRPGGSSSVRRASFEESGSEAAPYDKLESTTIKLPRR